MRENLVRFYEKKVIVNGILINLTNCEYLCLFSMLKAPSVILKKSQLINATWGETNNYEDNLVQLIHRLRSKLKNAGGERLITCVRGVGYIFDKTSTWDIFRSKQGIFFIKKNKLKPLSPDLNYSTYVREKTHVLNIFIEME